MKRGCTATMLKRKCSRRSGWENPRHDRKKKNTSVSLKCEGDVGRLFFDWNGIVHHEFVPRGETVNKQFYWKVMKRLREALRRKRPEAWTNRPGCCTMTMHLPTRRFLSVNIWRARDDCRAPRPLFSRFCPCGLFPVPKLKCTLKGRRFQTVEEIKENSLHNLRAIS